MVTVINKQVNVWPLKSVTLNTHSAMIQVRVVINEKGVGTFNEDLNSASMEAVERIVC